jgi:hypothetical protein
MVRNKGYLISRHSVACIHIHGHNTRYVNPNTNPSGLLEMLVGFTRIRCEWQRYWMQVAWCGHGLRRVCHCINVLGPVIDRRMPRGMLSVAIVHASTQDPISKLIIMGYQNFASESVISWMALVTLWSKKTCALGTNNEQCGSARRGQYPGTKDWTNSTRCQNRCRETYPHHITTFNWFLNPLSISAKPD